MKESGVQSFNQGRSLGHGLTQTNGMNGMSDTEGKAAQGSAERLGRGVSFKPDKKTVVLVTFSSVNQCLSLAV
jgi:hypothetical protein